MRRGRTYGHNMIGNYAYRQSINHLIKENKKAKVRISREDSPSFEIYVPNKRK